MAKNYFNQNLYFDDVSFLKNHLKKPLINMFSPVKIKRMKVYRLEKI